MRPHAPHTINVMSKRDVGSDAPTKVSSFITVVIRGGRFRGIHTPMVTTGETREMQGNATPAE